MTTQREPRKEPRKLNGLENVKPPERASSAKVRDALMAWIRDNRLEAGDRLPPQAELSTVLQAGTHTIHRAMTELVAAGIIRRRPGEGTVLLRSFDETFAFGEDVRSSDTNGRTSASAFQNSIAFVLAGLETDASGVPSNPYQTSWLALSALERELQGAPGFSGEVRTVVWNQDVDPVKALAEMNASGAIVMWIGDDYGMNAKWRRLRAAMLSLDVPVVHVGRMGFDTAEVQNLVFPDQVAMGVAAARHLAGLGHRRFMAVHSQKRFGFELDRLKGFENYLIGKGGVRPRICVGGCAKESGDWKPVGAGAFAEWAAISPDSRPTAVFCVNDGTAAGFILAARAAGVRVPEDVSVMGVDNFHSLFYPQGIDLTTLDQNFDGVAAEAIALLVALMSGTRRHASIIKIEPRLIVRSTTARIE